MYFQFKQLKNFNPVIEEYYFINTKNQTKKKYITTFKDLCKKFNIEIQFIHPEKHSFKPDNQGFQFNLNTIKIDFSQNENYIFGENQ